MQAPTIGIAQTDALDSIRSVCVIGAGTMGAGIAAHLANLGFAVTLLDVSIQAGNAGLERAKHAHPPHFFVPERAAEIRVGATSEQLQFAAECDWVIEAIVENLDLKKELFRSLDGLLGPNTFVTTNTSGLPIAALCEGRSDSFKRRFVGTHFFNPPRYMKLLELIPTPSTDPQFLASLKSFLERRVARRVVIAKDSPGFIANRYGMWCMYHAVHVSEQLHLTVEQVDAITGSFLGRPSSASFRLNDIVGLDVMRDIATNLLERCKDDPFIETLKEPASMFDLRSRGWIGQKAGRGYYRKEANEILVADLQTYAYRERREVDFASLAALGSMPLGERLGKALALRDEVGEFLRLYLGPTLRYANYLRERVCHQTVDFDRVMEWGFGWEMGPFRMIDAIGGETFDLDGVRFYRGNQQLGFSGPPSGPVSAPVSGVYTPIPTEESYRPLESYPVIDESASHRVRDLGDGVTLIGTTTKMGVITPSLVEDLINLLEAKHLTKIVLTSEAKAFSVGFDLNFFIEAISEDRFDDIEAALERLAYLGVLLETRSVVAAVQGYCLGAGLELALSCSTIVANAEAKIGLPESRVGLIPGGRGTALTRLMSQDSTRRLVDMALNLATGVTSSNAPQATALGYLRATDEISFHPDGLIADAKRLALIERPLSRPDWQTAEGPLVGMIDRALEILHSKGQMTDHDMLISSHIKSVYAKSNSFDDAVAHERASFIELCRKALTQSRIKHMIQTGKPLRN